MALQLLCQLEVRDFLSWRVAFDEDHERRATAGLSVLQIWRELDNSHQVFVLMRANDVAEARNYIASPLSDTFPDRTAIAATEYHLLETL